MEPIGGHLISRLHALRKSPTAQQSRLIARIHILAVFHEKGMNSPLNL
jgi:hypothetical protein